MVAPLPASIDSVMRFLANTTTATCVTPACDFITATVDVPTASRLLHAEYREFQHTSGLRLWATPSYSLPASLAAHVDFVSPTTHLPTLPTAPRGGRQLLGGGGGGNTPDSLRKLYAIGDVEGTGHTKQAATGFLGPFRCQSDTSRLIFASI
jgi:hypothetical protein